MRYAVKAALCIGALAGLLTLAAVTVCALALELAVALRGVL